MINDQPHIINAILIGQNKTGLLSDRIMHSADIQTRIILHDANPCILPELKDLENRIIIGAFSDIKDRELGETLADFEKKTFEDQTLIIEKKYQPLLNKNLTDLQKSFLFAVPWLKPESLYETIILAFEHSRQIIDLQRDIRSRHSAIGLIRSGVFEVRTPKEARNLSTMLSLLCPQPELTGAGLFELMMNAIEHGNLEIGFERKISLIKQGHLSTEIHKRLECQDLRHRVVKVCFQEKTDRYLFQIEDQGHGFESRKIQKLGHTTVSGRGIHIARTLCFNRLQYRMGGRIAIATLFKKEQVTGI